MSHLSDLLKSKEKSKKKEPSERLKILAMILASKALTLAGSEDELEDEDGNFDYSKTIPTVPWVT